MNGVVVSSANRGNVEVVSNILSGWLAGTV
jgi:hypothetical protein